MGCIRSCVFRNYGRHITLLVMFIAVLLTSCSIKSSIRNFVGLESNTTQTGRSNQTVPVTNTLELCSDPIDNGSARVVSEQLSVLLPDEIPSRLLSYPFRIVECLRWSPILYNRLWTVETLPIFLQYRKLRI